MKSLYPIVAVVTLILLVWASFVALQDRTFWDMEWVYEGYISTVYENSLAQELGLKSRTWIKTVEGAKPNLMPTLAQGTWGDTLTITLQNKHQFLYPITKPSFAQKLAEFERPFIGFVF